MIPRKRRAKVGWMCDRMEWQWLLKRTVVLTVESSMKERPQLCTYGRRQDKRKTTTWMERLHTEGLGRMGARNGLLLWMIAGSEMILLQVIVFTNYDSMSTTEKE